MKIANYLVIYEVVIKQNLREFLDISEVKFQYLFDNINDGGVKNK